MKATTRMLAFLMLGSTCLLQPQVVRAQEAQEAPAEDGEARAEDDAVIAELQGQPIRRSRQAELGSLIFGTLIEHYAEQQKIEATPADIEAFLAKSNQMKVEKRAEWQTARRQILAELESQTQPEARRQELASRLETLDSLLAEDPELEAYERQNPELVRQLAAETATRFIRSFKINQSLFERYGGRVIFQQAGPEPIDAYRDFLKEHEKKGTFRILDQDVASSFWKYFVNDAMHSFMAETPEEGEKIFSTPWWLMDQPPER